MVIDSFRGPYAFLSNMYPARIVFDALTFTCSEAAYQAAKCADPNDRFRFRDIDGFTAKRLGRSIDIRPDWDAVKVDTMRRILANKFRYSEPMGARLLATGDAEIIEGNHWNDTFWGVCRGVGENWLGKLLMARRAELQQTAMENAPATPAGADHEQEDKE